MTDKFYDLTNPNFVGIMWRFLVNLVFLFILIRVIYFRYSRKEKFLFSFFLMGIMAFFITSMLRSVFIEMGMAVGLFAVFGILRLRSKQFQCKRYGIYLCNLWDFRYKFVKIAKVPFVRGFDH